MKKRLLNSVASVGAIAAAGVVATALSSGVAVKSANAMVIDDFSFGFCESAFGLGQCADINTNGTVESWATNIGASQTYATWLTGLHTSSTDHVIGGWREYGLAAFPSFNPDPFGTIGGGVIPGIDSPGPFFNTNPEQVQLNREDPDDTLKDGILNLKHASNFGSVVVMNYDGFNAFDGQNGDVLGDYDGGGNEIEAPGHAPTIDEVGLGGLDITQGGATQIDLPILISDPNATVSFTFRMWSGDDGNGSATGMWELTKTFSPTTSPTFDALAPTTLGFDFNDSNAVTTSGFSLTDIGAIQFEILSSLDSSDYGGGVDLRIGEIATNGHDDPPPREVAEPSSLAVAAMGLLGLGYVRRRRRS